MSLMWEIVSQKELEPEDHLVIIEQELICILVDKQDMVNATRCMIRKVFAWRLNDLCEGY